MGYLHLLNISTEPGVENSAKVFKKSFIYYVLINLCFTLLKGVYSNYVTMVFLTILLISNKLKSTTWLCLWWFCCQVMSNSCDHMDCEGSAWLLCPWDFPGKNTGEGCHFFFQCCGCMGWAMNESLKCL